MKTVQTENRVKRGKAYFRFLKSLMGKRYPAPRYTFLGEEFPNGSIMISNHEGTDAPMALELYMDRPIRMWTAHEMNSGVFKLYGYQTKIYYHEKKHWNLFAARVFCLIASPLTNLFYSGMPLISTYRDARFYKTIRESVAAIEKGETIVIFPEDSHNGYLPELEGFFGGFLMLAKHLKRKGIDAPIVVSYFQKANNRYIFDRPVYYSELLETYGDHDTILAYLLKRCNEIGKIPDDETPNTDTSCDRVLQECE